MTSERIKHDGSDRCPVEDDAIVVVNDFPADYAESRAATVNWVHVTEYRIKQGWSRPLADIFAELPDEAGWIVADCEGSRWFECEPSLEDGIWDSPHGLGAESVFDTYVGDWRESKRKRPEPELPEIEPVGQARAKAKTAPWFIIGYCDEIHGPYKSKSVALSEAERMSSLNSNKAYVACRAVASFTAKVERTTYENGGE